MKIIVKKGNVTDVKTEAVILALFEENKKLFGLAYDVDAKSQGLISELISSGDFEGKESQVSVIFTRGLIPAKRIAVVGLGKTKEFKLDKLRAAYAKVTRHLRDINIKEAATALDFNMLPGQKEKLAQAALEGAVLGLYQYTPFKTVDRENIKDIKQLELIAKNEDYTLLGDIAKKTSIITDAVYFVRNLVSAPANEMTPSILAQKAREVARRKTISCKVLDKAAMKKLGMNALLGVASGSAQEPKFIIMEYSGGKKSGAPIVLVGKGLTFDSGGISIKPSEKMDEMKTDMSGGAAVIGAIMAVSDLRLPLN
ncbi:MAG TPA: M17 family peptidase N-terminal domain-containing protein, partial [Smithellaceae bacterium]|nr:M17 family peptidase N-terminal domain-containing protein [Smithellaceae bacterium]